MPGTDELREPLTSTVPAVDARRSGGQISAMTDPYRTRTAASPAKAATTAEADPAVDEQQFLASYDPGKFAPVAVTVDVAVFTVRQGKLCVLLIERDGHPFRGCWALPGGFIEPDETLDQGAARELQEETGLEEFSGHLEQLGTFGDPGRDPRMRVVSVAYLAFAPNLPQPVAGSDARTAKFWPVEDLDLDATGSTDAPGLAFDHATILRAALDRARAKLEYTPLATAFCEDPFTLPELRRIYEAVWGESLHDANFRRKVTSTPGFVQPLQAKTDRGGEAGGRRMQLFTRGEATLLHPPLLRTATRDSVRDAEGGER